MKKILNYIVPIFFCIEKSGDRYVINARADLREFSYKFSLTPTKDKSQTVEAALTALSGWLPQKRRFFCSSKEFVKQCLTKEFIETVNSLIVKNVNRTIWAEILNYFNVDTYLENVGYSVNVMSGSKCEIIERAYDIIVMGDSDNMIVENAWKAEKAVRDYTNSLTWVEQARGGQTNLNELFAACGNHMLGEDFTIEAEKESIFKLNQKISISASRATAIADLEEISMLSSEKIYINIENNKFVACMGSGAHIETILDDKGIQDIETVLPLRRVFIGFGSETLKGAQKHADKYPIMKEISESYVDISKPFAKTLLGKTFENILKMFEIVPSNDRSRDIKELDNAVFKDIVKSIDICMKKCYEYMVPLDYKKFEESYKGLFQAVFGQAFKYFYSISTDVK